MRNDDIDEVFRRADGGRTSVDPALLDRISKKIGSSLRPVRPLPASWVLVSALAAGCVAVATAGAALLGLHGVRSMSAVDIGLIFPTLGALIFAAGVTNVSQMIPGSRRAMVPWLLLTAGSLALIAVFAFLFRDYRTERFVPEGVKCLIAGLLLAIPAGLAGWLIVRRGFAVNSLAAGLAQGALAGLSGVTMLELHCANFQALHVMLWHTAVVPLSGAAGVLLIWMTRRPRRKPQIRV